MSKMELGELKQEVIHAVQKPFIRLEGPNEYWHPPGWKSAMKKQIREITNKIQNSVVYEISNEILEYLESSVLKGNQRQLYQAMLNARPRHYNQWIEYDLGHLYEGQSIHAHHVHATNHVGILKNGRLAGRKNVARGDVFSFDHFYDYQGEKKVATHFHSAKTCLWSENGRHVNQSSTGKTDQQRREDEAHSNALWFLGDGHAELSPDMLTLLDRWTGGVNNFIADTPENNQGVITSDEINKNRYARLIAMLSLMNYDWFIEQPKDLGIQGRRFRQEVVPGDAHHRIVLKLPKTKGRVIVPKMPRRSEPYGVKKHEVSGHERKYRDSHGNVYKTIYIKPHWRGDERLGIITKDYVVEKDDKEED